MKRLAVLVLIAACSDPPFELRFALTDGDSQRCISDTNGLATTDCADVTMACPAVLSVRIVPPNDPTVPYISICKPLTAQGKLCAIAGVDLPVPTVPVPEQVLEVQMAVFPKASDMATDPTSGELICPVVAYGADNLPIPVQQECEQGQASCPVVPAVGGRSYYYPGDAKTVVHLGCTDLEQLQSRSCSNTNTITASASVIDFDTGFPISGSLAQRLTVALGEPAPVGDAFGLITPDERELPLLTGSSPPAWQANVDLSPKAAICLDVVEGAAQSTAALTCQVASPSLTRVDMTGVRLAKPTLDKILTAIGKTSFPSQGLVIGLVLNSNNSPLSGAAVSTSGSGSIQYLSDDLASVSTGSVTTMSGVFVSQDAMFGTTFEAQSGVDLAPLAYGGLVNDKVTIAVIRFGTPSTGG